MAPSKTAKAMFSDDESDSDSSDSGSASSSSSSDSGRDTKTKKSSNIVTTNLSDTFTINKKYAERFEHNKRREETHRLQEKVKREYIIRPGDENDSDSESSSSESDEGDVPVKFDKQFADVLQKIKNKDPRLYDEEQKVFSSDDDDDDDSSDSDSNKKTKKPPRKQTLRQVTAKQLLEGGAEAFETEEEEKSLMRKTVTNKSYVEEQEDLKNAFKDAAGISSGKIKNKKSKKKSEDAMDSDSDSDSDFDGLRVKKGAAGFLDGDDLDDDDRDDGDKTKSSQDAKTKLGEFFGETKSDDKNEQFLRDFLLHEQWRDDGNGDGGEDGKSGFTYNKNRKDKGASSDSESEEDAQAFEEAERFEQKYNFRFEEPDGGTIVSHARTIEGTVRKESSTRRDARASRKERKMSEKERLRAEVRRLKNLKREEIRAKMAQIAQVGGLAGADAVAAADLNAEFDPDAHDKLMSQMYDDQYYSGVLLDEHGEELAKPAFGDLDDEVNDLLGKATEEEGGAAEESEKFKKVREAMMNSNSKPQFEGDQGDDIDDDWEDEEGDGDDDGDEEDGDGDGDRDGDGANPNQGNKFSKRASKRWKKELLAKMDEYYKLDAEDFIDDVPCRFKYKEVAPSMFGLSTKDILHMSDRDLTQIVPLKKLAPYRHDSDFTTAPKEKMRSQRMAREFLAEAAKRKGKGKVSNGEYKSSKIGSKYKKGGKKMSARERKGKRKQSGGSSDSDSEDDAETQAADRFASYGARAWGKYNVDKKGKGKKSHDEPKDVGDADGGKKDSSEKKSTTTDIKPSSDAPVKPGSGKNAKKNLKKRQKKNELEKAKAAGMV